MAALTRLLRTHGVLLIGPVVAVLVSLSAPAPATASLIGELSGTVTGRGGSTVPSVWVTLTPVTDYGEPSGNPEHTLTDTAGRYEFPEVNDQNVKIQVRAPLSGELVDTYWPGVHTFAQAGIIEISEMPVTADIALPVGGSVSGRVVDVQTGDPVPGAQVSAMIAASPESGPFGLSDRAGTPGAFSLSGLPPVPMELQVRLPAHSPYLAAGPGESTGPVPIDGTLTTTGLVIGLRRGSEIRGTVRDDTGAAVAGAQIKVVGCLPTCPLIATSDDSGSYRLVGVSPASRLGVVAWKGERLMRQWYPGRDNASRATDISLEAGEVRDDVDFELTRGAFVTVGVNAADSAAPLPGAIVQLISSTDPFEHFFALKSPDGAGRMRVGPVPPGSYTLNVTPGAANPGYLPVRRLLDEQVAPTGILELGAEDDLDLVAALPPAVGEAEVGDVSTAAGWPGLAQGFLRLGADHPLSRGALDMIPPRGTLVP